MLQFEQRGNTTFSYLLWNPAAVEAEWQAIWEPYSSNFFESRRIQQQRIPVTIDITTPTYIPMVQRSTNHHLKHTFSAIKLTVIFSRSTWPRHKEGL